MKTAVEWYAEQEIKLTLDFLANKINQLEYGIKRVKLIEQAKEIFEKQIMNARQNGLNNSFRRGDRKNITNEQYYNETYNSERIESIKSE